MSEPRRVDPLQGVTLKAIVEHLVDRYGWGGLGTRIDIRCFTQDPSVPSSLKFLRKTPWARAKVESLYLHSVAHPRKRAAPPPGESPRAGIRFEDGAAYERYMGTWSQLAGATFLDWLAPAPALRWLDVGCGNGAFTELLVERCAPAAVHGIDPSEAQLAHARTRFAPHVAEFQQGDAMALPFADDAFDAAVMPLVLFFVPDPATGVAEMARVVRPGGTVAAYAWDMQGGGFPYDAVQAELRASGADVPLPPSPEASRMEVLRDLWTAAGLDAVETHEITVQRTFADFDDYWTTILGGPSVGRQLAAMTPAERARFVARLRERLPAVDAAGRLTTSARANAVRGRVRGAA